MLLALVSAAVPAAAQSVSGEIAGGYSYLRIDGEGLPEGWFVSGAVDLTPALSIVGEVFSNVQEPDAATSWRRRPRMLVQTC